MSPRGQRQRAPLLLLILLLISPLLHLPITRAAEVGYGPLFDPCGDNCQTQMVNFCTVGHDTAQMRICWCDSTEYIERMDTCLNSCDPAVGNKTTQRDQMLRYRSILCEPTAITKDVEFQEYYRTRFASIDGGSFTPEVTRGIPPPTASPVKITGEVTLAPESSSGIIGSNTISPSSEFTSIITLTVSATPTTSSFVTAIPSTAAGLTLQKNGLSTAQLFGVILGTAVVSVLLSLSIVFCIRRRHPRRPFWNPPPPPPLPRFPRPPTTSFLPYYAPISPPPTILPQRIHGIEPHAIATSIASTLSTRDGDSSVVSPTRGRGGYSYSQLESPILPTPPQSQFYARQISVSTRMLTPVVAYAQSMIQVTSSSAIAAAAAAERNSRGSTHTLIEPEPQQVILEGTVVDRSRSQSRPGNSGGERRAHFDESGYCAEDDSMASCSSWSERSWCEEEEEEEDDWWDLRGSQMMGP